MVNLFSPSDGSYISACYRNSMAILTQFGDRIDTKSYDELIYNNFFRILNINGKYHLLFWSDFIIHEPLDIMNDVTMKTQIRDMFQIYKKYYEQSIRKLSYNRHLVGEDAKTAEPIIENYMNCIKKYLDRCVEESTVNPNCKKVVLNVNIIVYKPKKQKR